MKRKGAGETLLWTVAFFLVSAMLISWYLSHAVTQTSNLPSSSISPIQINFTTNRVVLTVNKTVYVDYYDALKNIVEMPVGINETAFISREYPKPFIYYDYYSSLSFKGALLRAMGFNVSKVSRHAFNFVNLMANIFHLYYTGYNAYNKVVRYDNILHSQYSMMDYSTLTIDPDKAKNGFNLTIKWLNPSNAPLDKIELPYPVWATYVSYSKDEDSLGYYEIWYHVGYAWWSYTRWNYGYDRYPESGWYCWNSTQNTTECRIWKYYYSDITGKAYFYKYVYDYHGNLISSSSYLDTGDWDKTKSSSHYLYSDYNPNSWVNFWVERYCEVADDWWSGNTHYAVIECKHDPDDREIRKQDYWEYFQAKKFKFVIHFKLHDGNVSSVKYEPPDVQGVKYDYTLAYPDLYIYITFTLDAYHYSNGTTKTLPLGRVYDTVQVDNLKGGKRYYNLGTLKYTIEIYVKDKVDEDGDGRIDKVYYGIRLKNISVNPTEPPEWVYDNPPSLPSEYYEQLQTYGYYKSVADVLYEEKIDDVDFFTMLSELWERIYIEQSDEDFIDDQWIPLIEQRYTNNYGALIFGQAIALCHYWTSTFEYDESTGVAKLYLPPAEDKETEYFMFVSPANGGADDWIELISFYDPHVGYLKTTAGIFSLHPRWVSLYPFLAPSDVGFPKEGDVIPIYRGFPFWTDYIGVKWRYRYAYVYATIQISGSEVK